MPTSAKTFNSEMEQLLQTYIVKGMKRFLDVGAGAAKYGKMLNSLRDEYGAQKNFEGIRIAAVEPNWDYSYDYDLEAIYDDLFHSTIEEFINLYPSKCHDVVIFGDILEHLPKSVGISVLEFFLYRSSFIIVVVPKMLIQFDKDNLLENHNSYWTEADFLKYNPVILDKKHKMMVQMRGFLRRKEAVIQEASYDIMKRQGCSSFLGIIVEKE